LGKRILTQRRGRGGQQYRAPKKGKIAPANYPEQSSQLLNGEVVDIIHEITGLKVGGQIMMGKGAKPLDGNILPLSDIPEGSIICNIELNKGDGGKLVKAPGGSATLYSHTPLGAIIKFPSGKAAVVKNNCRASLGKIAGWGRSEKPFLRAGPKHHLMLSKGQIYPRVRGVAMASVHHPFGGGRHQHPGKPTTTSRNAPPGRKVGLVAARKTGTKRISRSRMVVKK
jgi:large subunit ribosomal protein L2